MPLLDSEIKADRQETRTPAHHPPPMVPKHQPISAQPCIVEVNSCRLGNGCRPDQLAEKLSTVSAHSRVEWRPESALPLVSESIHVRCLIYNQILYVHNRIHVYVYIYMYIYMWHHSLCNPAWTLRVMSLPFTIRLPCLGDHMLLKTLIKWSPPHVFLSMSSAVDSSFKFPLQMELEPTPGPVDQPASSGLPSLVDTSFADVVQFSPRTRAPCACRWQKSISHT